MRIKLEYIEIQMLLAGLDAMHLPSVTHYEVKTRLYRRLERMERDYTSGYADNPISAPRSKLRSINLSRCPDRRLSFTYNLDQLAYIM